MYDGNFAKLKDIDEIENITIPEQLPVLPLRDFIIYPHMVSPLIIARDKSLKMIEDVMQSHKLICLVAQKDPENENPDQKALFKFGTVAFVLKMLRFPDNSVRILVQGLSRIKVQKFTKQDPYFVAKIKQFHDNYKIDMELLSNIMFIISIIAFAVIFIMSFMSKRRVG